MARIPYPDTSAIFPELRETLAGLPAANVFRMLGHGGPISLGFLAFGGALRTKSQLNPLLREMVIVRVGLLCRAEYEVYHHTNALHRLGVDIAKIEALQDGPDSPVFDEGEQTILRFVDALVFNVKAGHSLFNQVHRRFNHACLLELIMLVGHYMMVSRILENLEVDIETEPVESRS